MEVVASLSQGRTAAAQCGLFTHKSVPVIFEPPCTERGEEVWCAAGCSFLLFSKLCAGYAVSREPYTDISTYADFFFSFFSRRHNP